MKIIDKDTCQGHSYIYSGKPFIPMHPMYVMACGGVNRRPFIFVYSHFILFQLIFCKFMEILVSFTAIFRLVTQRWEERDEPKNGCEGD